MTRWRCGRVVQASLVGGLLAAASLVVGTTPASATVHHYVDPGPGTATCPLTMVLKFSTPITTAGGEINTTISGQVARCTWSDPGAVDPPVVTVLGAKVGGSLESTLPAPGDVSATPSIEGGTLSAAGSPYEYQVTALNANGQTVPYAPVIATVASGLTGSVVVTWDPVSGATSYDVYGRSSQAPSLGLLATVFGETYTDTGADAPGTSPPVDNSAFLPPPLTCTQIGITDVVSVTANSVSGSLDLSKWRGSLTGTLDGIAWTGGAHFSPTNLTLTGVQLALPGSGFSSLTLPGTGTIAGQSLDSFTNGELPVNSDTTAAVAATNTAGTLAGLEAACTPRTLGGHGHGIKKLILKGTITVS